MERILVVGAGAMKLARHGVTGDDRDLPRRAVTGLVERGELGRKTGRGFSTYDESGNRT